MSFFAEKIVRFCLIVLALGCAAPAAARSPEPALEIMTFNVRLPLTQDGPNAWEHRRDLAAQMIAAERPDIVATQELFKTQGDYLLARLPGYAWFGLDRKGGHGDEHMGIFYRRDRLRLLELGNFWLSDTPRIPGSITWGHPYPRMVTWGLFQTSAGRRFYVANTHFPYREQDGEARRKGAAQILAWIGTLPPEVPVVLAGDFNTEPGSEPHALLTTQLGDAWLGAAERAGPEATFHAFTGKGTRRIDWILARGLRAQRIRTLTINRRGLYPSDHHPVIADLEWVSGPVAAVATRVGIWRARQDSNLRPQD